ncbi:MAG: hypothetical protein ABH824_04540 [Nanoarchaeota archaeon]
MKTKNYWFSVLKKDSFLFSCIVHLFRINEDVITTVRFRPKDIRVRRSNKMKEIVFKDGNPTSFLRNEISINLKDFDDCEKTIFLLKELGFKDDPSWVKKKEEFICEHEKFQYTLSLQHIENFAYLLEAEIISETKEDSEMHILNLKKILENLGCQPIEAVEFKSKIEEYIKENRSNKILK